MFAVDGVLVQQYIITVLVHGRLQLCSTTVILSSIGILVQWYRAVSASIYNRKLVDTTVNEGLEFYGEGHMLALAKYFNSRDLDVCMYIHTHIYTYIHTYILFLNRKKKNVQFWDKTLNKMLKFYMTHSEKRQKTKTFFTKRRWNFTVSVIFSCVFFLRCQQFFANFVKTMGLEHCRRKTSKNAEICDIFQK